MTKTSTDFDVAELVALLFLQDQLRHDIYTRALRMMDIISRKPHVREEIDDVLRAKAPDEAIQEIVLILRGL